MKLNVRMLTIVCLLVFLASGDVLAQVCRVYYEGENQSRKVSFPPASECTNVFTSPFAYWGVTSNYGWATDNGQFEGWKSGNFSGLNGCGCSPLGCAVSKNLGSWKQWNSCSTYFNPSCAGCSFYNSSYCSQQQTTTGINSIGIRWTNNSVDCPYDWDGDGQCDDGGCLWMDTWYSGTNFMSMYERRGSDQFVETLYFPSTSISLSCDVWGCSGGTTAWQTPNSYNNVYAKLRSKVTNVYFVDSTGYCADLAYDDPGYDCW